MKNKLKKSKIFYSFRKRSFQKKAAMELSVNAIVILILAIVMLGLGLGFIRGMFSKVSTQVEQQVAAEPEPSIPSAPIPITLSRESIITHAGDKEVMKVSVFNPTNVQWSGNPNIICEGFTAGSVSASANSRTIEQGKFATFNVLINIPPDQPNTYLCQMQMDGNGDTVVDAQKDLTIKIIQ